MAQKNKTNQKRQDYISWDECFMQMAYLIAQRSKDPNTQNGACIVDQDNIVIGLGYNGWPRGIKEESLPWGRQGKFLDTKYAYVVHAEANAVYNSSRLPKGCRIYVTMFPCNECAKAIIQNGIREVIYAGNPYKDKEPFIAAKRLFNKAGVKIRYYKTKKKLRLE